MITTISKEKNILDGINRRVDIVEGKISELEDIQQTIEKKKRIRKKRANELGGTP